MVDLKRKGRFAKKPKPKIRLYKMSVSTFFYDEETHQLVEYEHHFKIARRGRIRIIRRRLAKLGGRHLQNWLYKYRKVWIPKRKLRTAFEREQYAKKQEPYATVRRFTMRRIRKRWVAKELASGKMRYSRKRRKKAVKQ